MGEVGVGSDSFCSTVVGVGRCFEFCRLRGSPVGLGCGVELTSFTLGSETVVEAIPVPSSIASKAV